MKSPGPAPLPRSCSRHPREPSLTECKQCGFPLCNDCWTHVGGADPWCTTCATEVNTRAVRRWSWAVSFLALTIGSVIVGWRSSALAEEHGYVIAGGCLALVVFGLLVARALPKGHSPDIVLRTVEEPVPESCGPGQHAAHPYRARLRNAAMRAVPRVSGTQATLLVLACLGLCAVAFPAAMRLPRWVEIEVVLATWWAVFAAVLSYLLLNGLRIADDFRFTLTRPAADPKTSAASTTRAAKKTSWLDGCADPVGCADVEGCGAALVVVLAVAAVAGAAWLVAELVVPLFFAASYLLLTRALARVANDRHECAGKLGKSLVWGATWATVYVLPIAAAVWGLHRIWKR